MKAADVYRDGWLCERATTTQRGLKCGIEMRHYNAPDLRGLRPAAGATLSHWASSR